MPALDIRECLSILSVYVLLSDIDLGVIPTDLYK